MITISKLYKSFASNLVLNCIDLKLEDNQIYGLIGPSGGGKSTLLKIIGQVLHADQGQINYDQINLADMALMFQEGALFDSLTVFDNVAFNLVNGRVPTSLLAYDEREKIEEKVSNMLARVGLTASAFKMPGQLSGGMRRRASLARALVSSPKLVLLDDPTAGLDPIASSVIMELIVELQSEYQPCMLIVSHDLRRLLPQCDRVLALFDNQIKFEGSLNQIQQANAEIKHFIACRYDLNSLLENREAK